MMSLANDDTQTYCILNWLSEFWGATSGLVFLYQTGRTDSSTEQDARWMRWALMDLIIRYYERAQVKLNVNTLSTRSSFSHTGELSRRLSGGAFLCLYPSSILCQWTFRSPYVVCPFVQSRENQPWHDVEHLCWQNGTLWPLFFIIWVICFVDYILNYFWSCI